MALVVPQVAEQIILTDFLTGTLPEALTLHLYTNIYTPVETSVTADFTEALGNGYAAIPLTTTWNIVPGNPSVADHAQETFTFTGALGLVYGYYVTRASGETMWAEQFTNGPYDIQTSSDQIRITPRITAD